MEKQLASAEPSTSKEESMAENGSDYENRIFNEISRGLSSEQCQMFGRELGLSINELMDLEVECTIYHFGRELKIVRMLDKWKSKNNPDEDQLVPLLAKALKVVKRKDIADSIEEKFQYENRHILTKIQIRMKETQKRKYRNSSKLLPRSLWLEKKRLLLEKLYVKLTMMRKSEMGENEDKEIGVEKIFDETESNIPRRILIEGHPGYGKTTLVKKLLSDWLKREKYITDRFDLVFVIALRNFTGNLSSHFLQQCERVEGSEDVKLKAIKAIEERVLLLLDGLDEIPTGNKETLYRLFEGEDYPDMTVVVTCRTGFLPKETTLENNSEILENKRFEMDFVWDKKVEIQGISYEERKLFIKKYLNINDQQLNTTLDETDLQNEMYKCPLFLLLLAVLIQEKHIQPINTKTELHKTMLNFVINRGLEKVKGKRKEIDVFNLHTETDESGYKNLLINFGRLCLKKVKERSLIFEESELLNCSGDGNGDEDLILKLGFLSKQISFPNYEEKKHYEPIHRSFLEFSAAYFLSSFDGMEREIQKLVKEYKVYPNRDQLLFAFLGGLLQSNSFKLFNSLSPYTYLISIFHDDDDSYDNDYESHNVENVLLEIPQTEEIFKSLERS